MRGCSAYEVVFTGHAKDPCGSFLAPITNRMGSEADRTGRSGSTIKRIVTRFFRLPVIPETRVDSRRYNDFHLKCLSEGISSSFVTAIRHRLFSRHRAAERVATARARLYPCKYNRQSFNVKS
jgi:hypothetical protein